MWEYECFFWEVYVMYNLLENVDCVVVYMLVYVELYWKCCDEEVFVFWFDCDYVDLLMKVVYVC